MSMNRYTWFYASILALFTACQDATDDFSVNMITFGNPTVGVLQDAATRSEAPATIIPMTGNLGSQQFCLEETVVPMGPSMLGAEATTRAGLVETISDFHKTYGVYAYKDDGSLFFNNLEVSRRVDNEKNTTTNPYPDYMEYWFYRDMKHWPATGTLDFYAYAPYPTQTNILNFDSDAKTITLVTPSRVTNQRDFMIATPVSRTIGAAGYTNAIAFTFNHVCAALKFRVKNGAADKITTPFRATKVTVSDVYGTAVYDLTTCAIKAGTTPFGLANFELVSDDPTTDYFEWDPTQPSKNVITKDDHQDIFIMIPQTTPATAEVTIELYIDVDGDGLDDDATKPGSQRTFKASLAGKTWLAGNIYYYTLDTIDGNKNIP